MTAAVWPPPADETTQWRTQAVRLRSERWPYSTGEESAKVRQVKLWGRSEWVDDQGRVLCNGCMRLVEMAELCRPGNGHSVSPVASPGEVRVASWSEHQGPA